MGAAQSGGIEIGGSSMGYQVVRVYPDGPGSRAGLKAYFDFIISIGNTRFSKESGSLREILKASVDQKLKMSVYNTRSKVVREVEIVPSLNWGGNGLLGVSIKHTSFDRADERVWHVVEVEPGSPAQQAGLKPDEDFVIGADSILQEDDDLYNLIEAHEGKALKLFVYNVKNDNCREVICHPNSKWGGKGYLGCEFGHGLLHRIPSSNAGVEDSSRHQPFQAPRAPQALQHLQSLNQQQQISSKSSGNNQVPLASQQYQHQQHQHQQQHQQPQLQSQPQYQHQHQHQHHQQQQQNQHPLSAPYQFSQLGQVSPPSPPLIGSNSPPASQILPPPPIQQAAPLPLYSPAQEQGLPIKEPISQQDDQVSQAVPEQSSMKAHPQSRLYQNPYQPQPINQYQMQYQAQFMEHQSPDHQQQQQPPSLLMPSVAHQQRTSQMPPLSPPLQPPPLQPPQMPGLQFQMPRE